MEANDVMPLGREYVHRTQAIRFVKAFSTTKPSKHRQPSSPNRWIQRNSPIENAPQA
jgi:hypothetical protein